MSSDPIRPRIDPETAADHDAIRDIVRAAFADHQEVADLVDAIRTSPQFVPELSLVARWDDEVVGHVMVSHTDLVEVDGRRHRTLSLSPLAVKPALQRRGIGSALVRSALHVADTLGEPLVVLEGAPAYYSRFGFVDCRTLGIQVDLPDWAPREAGQAYPLTGYHPGLRGRLEYPPAFAAVLE
ncbi:GNAT family N-acetyltransferase [Angustibacter sp. McL0619]|uniref:GNAT family N-acetyltransferase n=1 Tax=Angustibacter sp. McL0619 TaxID=3415676 RepID=UPI003CEF852F